MNSKAACIHFTCDLEFLTYAVRALAFGSRGERRKNVRVSQPEVTAGRSALETAGNANKSSQMRRPLISSKTDAKV